MKRAIVTAMTSLGLFLSAGAAFADHPRGSYGREDYGHDYGDDEFDDQRFLSRWERPVRAELPEGCRQDRQGFWLGPHGGALTETGDLLLETVLNRSGRVRVFVYDPYGEAIPTDHIDLNRVLLLIDGRRVPVSLRPVSEYAFAGSLQTAYRPQVARGYNSFQVSYPRPVIVPRAAYPAQQRYWRSYNRPAAGVRFQVTIPLR